METKKFLQSKKFKIITAIIGSIAAALLFFWAGVAVGYHVAGFSYRFGDNYYKIFDGRRPGGLDDIDASLPAEHGATGIVASIALPNVVVIEQDKTEKIILITDKTILRSGQKTITPSDIRIGDFVVVAGTPDQNSKIEAEFIRVVPPPPSQLIGTSTSSTGATSN